MRPEPSGHPPQARRRLSSRAAGYVNALIAVVSWGTVFFAARFVFGSSTTHPLTLAFARYLFGTLALLPLVRRNGPRMFEALRRDAPLFAVLGFTGFFLMTGLGFTSLKYTTAASCSILFNANPLFILLMAFAFQRERIRPLDIVAVLLGFSGCGFVISGNFRPALQNLSGPAAWGNLLALGGGSSGPSTPSSGQRPPGGTEHLPRHSSHAFSGPCSS